MFPDTYTIFYELAYMFVPIHFTVLRDYIVELRNKLWVSFRWEQVICQLGLNSEQWLFLSPYYLSFLQ